MATRLLSHVLLPIASLDDAKRTCEAVRAYAEQEIEAITVLHVIEQTAGYMDTTSPEALEEEAEAAFEYVEKEFGDGPEIHREIRYGTDVVEEIVAAANELEASAIGFTPRPRSGFQAIIAEDISNRLTTEIPQPVIVFSPPAADSDPSPD